MMRSSIVLSIAGLLALGLWAELIGAQLPERYLVDEEEVEAVSQLNQFIESLGQQDLKVQENVIRAAYEPHFPNAEGVEVRSVMRGTLTSKMVPIKHKRPEPRDAAQKIQWSVVGALNHECTLETTEMVTKIMATLERDQSADSYKTKGLTRLLEAVLPEWMDDCYNKALTELDVLQHQPALKESLDTFVKFGEYLDKQIQVADGLLTLKGAENDVFHNEEAKAFFASKGHTEAVLAAGKHIVESKHFEKVKNALQEFFLDVKKDLNEKLCKQLKNKLIPHVELTRDLYLIIGPVIKLRQYNPEQHADIPESEKAARPIFSVSHHSLLQNQLFAEVGLLHGFMYESWAEANIRCASFQ